jgi:hypothetical protein
MLLRHQNKFSEGTLNQIFNKTFDGLFYRLGMRNPHVREAYTSQKENELARKLGLEK